MIKSLKLTHPALASDSRDKIYSLIGLMEETDRSAIAVDYSSANTPDQVFADMARYCVTTPNCMKMLALAGTKRNIVSLPTWVPDWTIEPVYPLDERLYRAAGNTALEVAEPSVSPDGRRLTIRAFPFDRISALSPAVSYEDFSIPEIRLASGSVVSCGIETLICLDQSAYMFASAIQAHFGRLPGPGTIEDVVSRTLTADRDLGNRRAQPSDRGYYDAFCRRYPRDGPLPEFGPGETPPDPTPFSAVAHHCNGGRRIFSTIAGQIGLAPDDARPDDWVALLPNCNLPLILRNIGGHEFQLVGHCYLDGAMDGEMLERFRLMFSEASIPESDLMNLFKTIVLV